MAVKEASKGRNPKEDVKCLSEEDLVQQRKAQLLNEKPKGWLVSRRGEV